MTASTTDVRRRVTTRWSVDDDATTVRGPPEATIRIGAAATTVRRTAVPLLNRLAPRVFSRAIRAAHFPARFRQPANLMKYSNETNPKLWLADYRLACQLGGADDDLLIIRNLPLFLSDSARA